MARLARRAFGAVALALAAVPARAAVPVRIAVLTEMGGPYAEDRGHGPPATLHDPWDLYDLVRTTPGEQAFRPMAGGGCALVPGG